MTKYLNYPKSVNCNNQLDAYERLVVDATKGNLIDGGDGYKTALRLIGEVIYNNKPNSTPKWVYLNYLMNLIIKTWDWSLESWTERVQQWVREATDDLKWHGGDFLDLFLRKHLQYVSGLKINEKTNGEYFNILNLDVDDDFRETVIKGLGGDTTSFFELTKSTGRLQS
jgi:hypothetical protein